MFKRILFALSVVLCIVSVSQLTAQADEYYSYGWFSVLADKYVNAYVNFKDAEQHNGWCYVPGNPEKRKNSWSCTIVDDPAGPRTELRSPGEGARASFDGATHTAHVRQPAGKRLPYCLPRYEEASNGIRLVYYCAYWVRNETEPGASGGPDGQARGSSSRKCAVACWSKDQSNVEDLLVRSAPSPSTW